MPFNIKADALVDIFEQYKGHTFCSLDTCTIPHLNKTGRVSGQTVMAKLGVNPVDIRKYSEFSAGIGYEYAYTVMNRLIKDGKPPFDYKPGETWHVPYGNSTVIRQHPKTGELYFYVTLIANNPPYTEYRAGKVLDRKDLEEFLAKDYTPANQGLAPDRVVEVRTLKLASVTRVVADKAEFIVS